MQACYSSNLLLYPHLARLYIERQSTQKSSSQPPTITPVITSPLLGFCCSQDYCLPSVLRLRLSTAKTSLRDAPKLGIFGRRDPRGVARLHSLDLVVLELNDSQEPLLLGTEKVSRVNKAIGWHRHKRGTGGEKTASTQQPQ